jgi:hypothetical protein
MHRTAFAAKHLPAGIYTLKLVYNDKVVTRKLMKE